MKAFAQCTTLCAALFALSHAAEAATYQLDYTTAAGNAIRAIVEGNLLGDNNTIGVTSALSVVVNDSESFDTPLFAVDQFNTPNARITLDATLFDLLIEDGRPGDDQFFIRIGAGGPDTAYYFIDGGARGSDFGDNGLAQGSRARVSDITDGAVVPLPPALAGLAAALAVLGAVRAQRALRRRPQSAA